MKDVQFLSLSFTHLHHSALQIIISFFLRISLLVVGVCLHWPPCSASREFSALATTFVFWWPYGSSRVSCCFSITKYLRRIAYNDGCHCIQWSVSIALSCSLYDFAHIIVILLQFTLVGCWKPFDLLWKYYVWSLGRRLIEVLGSMRWVLAMLLLPPLCSRNWSCAHCGLIDSCTHCYRLNLHSLSGHLHGSKSLGLSYWGSHYPFPLGIPKGYISRISQLVKFWHYGL